MTEFGLSPKSGIVFSDKLMASFPMGGGQYPTELLERPTGSCVQGSEPSKVVLTVTVFINTVVTDTEEEKAQKTGE